MCNLYNVTTNHEAIIQFARVFRDLAGNLEPSLDVYPNYKAPVVRMDENGERELTMLNWGMPSPPERVKGKADYGTTNIRRPNFGHWRQWLGIEHRCVVPATSFAEPSPTAGDKDPATGIQRNFWFALDETKPLVLFRRAMDALARHPPRQGRPAGSSALRFLHHRTERRRQADPRQGDAGDPWFVKAPFRVRAG